uniref:Uncharacterized protein n=1 Tax=Ditylenchus dipsaci TaxID=166011 RepID=A0A915E8E8_9BILA
MDNTDHHLSAGATTRSCNTYINTSSPVQQSRRRRKERRTHLMIANFLQETECWDFGKDKNISVGFSYTDGCSKIFKWSNELFYMGEDGKKAPIDCEAKISIDNGRTPRYFECYCGWFADCCPHLHLLEICLSPKTVSPTASTANPSAPGAVTCLPDVKVVKPTATTQPPPVSCDLKQGQKPVPIPQPPVSSDLKQGQKPAPLPPAPLTAMKIDLPAAPSDKLLAIDDGDEVRLAPNTIEITSLEKKRRKNRRMLKAVDEDENSAALKSRSLA